MKNTLIRVLALAVLLVMLIPELAFAESYKATVYTDTAKIYAKQSTSSKVLTTLKKGAAVTVTSVDSTWVKATSGKTSGYMLVKCLKSAKKVGVYANAKTKIYKTASTEGTVICTVSVDYPLYKVGMSGSFYLVEDKGGTFTGYIKKSCVSSSKKNPYAVASSAKTTYKANSSSTTMPSSIKSSQDYFSTKSTFAQRKAFIVYVAQCKLGCKYSSSPNGKTTFSDATLVKACMAALGYTTASKANQIGHNGSASYISRKNLMKGDIVCFDCDSANGNLVDHVGVYVGSGYFIHASQTAGCVIVSKMDSGYYYKTFCWGRRYMTE